MPDSSRSSVDLPAPLWPTRPIRSPCWIDRLMSRSASMTGTFWSVPILPPALPSTAFFSDRVFASKMGNSTEAFHTSMLTIGFRPHSDPVGHAGTVVAHEQQRERPADDGDDPGDHPVVPDDVPAQHGLPEHLHEVQERVELQNVLGEV